MAVIKHIQHIRSNEVTGTDPKSPASGDVHYGEIAINYHKGTETIFLRNDNDEIVKFKPGGIASVENTDGTLEVSTTDWQSTIDSALWELSSTSGVAAKYAYANTASGVGSFAVGYSTSASGQASHAEGSGTTASSSGSHAEGGATVANGKFSHAEGSGTTATGGDSHAEGCQTAAGGAASHAEGESTSAIGNRSHAEGYYTSASSNGSHTEGFATKTTGNYSHAEGSNTYATSEASHAEGYYTRASGNYSHAGGQSSTATGTASFAHGSGVSTGYDCETAFGQYNARSTGTDASAKTYFSVGIGTASNAKKNALEIRSNGDIYITTGNTATAAGTATLLQTELTVWNCGDYA